MPLQVIFDTNIWVAGLNWRVASYRCLLLARTGVIQLAFCQPMAAELAEKLRAKFRFSENDIRAVMYEYRKIAKQVTITGNLHVVDADPDDDKFIECAVVANAGIIVSEDHHLTDFALIHGIGIFTAQEFLKYLASLPAE